MHIHYRKSCSRTGQRKGKKAHSMAQTPLSLLGAPYRGAGQPGLGVSKGKAWYNLIQYMSEWDSPRQESLAETETETETQKGRRGRE